MRIFTLVVIGFLVLAGCNESSEKEKEVRMLSDTEQAANHMNMQAEITPVKNPSNGNSSLPRLFGSEDQLYMSWVTQQDSLATLYYARLAEDAWSTPEMITSGTDWFVNWADFPAIAANNGNLITNILQRSADGTYTYDVKLNLYSEAENKWVRNKILHNDRTKSEHGFVSVLPFGSSDFFISWLDGRKTTGGHDGHGSGAMTLRSAVVKPDGRIEKRTELDGRVCDCCSTAAAITENGPVVVYRDRSEDEIRDIAIVRWENNQWTPPVVLGKDHWKIAGCPVNGPAADAEGSSLVVAWFTAASGEGDVKVIFSEDNGKTFGSPYRIDGANATGRVDVVMISEKEAAVIWMEPEGDFEYIKMMRIETNGYTKAPVVISKTDASRASGFPQIERVGDRLYLAWTVTEDDKKHIETAKISLMNPS